MCVQYTVVINFTLCLFCIRILNYAIVVLKSHQLFVTAPKLHPENKVSLTISGQASLSHLYQEPTCFTAHTQFVSVLCYPNLYHL